MTLVGIVTFLFIDIVFDMAQVFGFIFVIIFFCYINDINPINLMTFLIVFIRFVFLKCLNLRLTISKREIVRIMVVFIPIPMLLIGFIFLSFLIDNLKLFRHLESIFFVSKGCYKLVFASLLTAFSITFSYISRSYPWLADWACIDKYNFLQK